MVILAIRTLCFSKENKSDDTLTLITDFTYNIGSGDSKDKYEALALYGAKSKAVALSAKYFTDKGLFENYGKKQREIFCLAANGHLYVVGRDFEEKSCQTRRKVGTRSDLSEH